MITQIQRGTNNPFMKEIQTSKMSLHSKPLQEEENSTRSLILSGIIFFFLNLQDEMRLELQVRERKKKKRQPPLLNFDTIYITAASLLLFFNNISMFKHNRLYWEILQIYYLKMLIRKLLNFCPGVFQPPITKTCHNTYRIVHHVTHLTIRAISQFVSDDSGPRISTPSWVTMAISC